MVRRFIANYVRRHQHWGNQLLHLVGLPITFVAPIVMLILGEWAISVMCFAAGYFLQFVGHAIEGNDAGEAIVVKKLLGVPYVEFGPNQVADDKYNDSGLKDAA